jgi:hypothetical protein
MQPRLVAGSEIRHKSGWKEEKIMTWWPGWNSIEGAAKWGDIFFWTGFALLVLLAGCEILSKVYSWRKDTLIAMRDDLIAVAQDARTKQADQNRPEALAGHDLEIAAPRLPAGEDDKAGPVPQPQPKIIVGLLSQFRGQKFSVVCIAGDQEGKSIGEEIVNVLRAAGWDFPEGGVGEATYSKEPIGLSLMVNAGQIMTPSVLRPVAMLVKALADAGLMQRNGALADPNVPRDRIEVRIGRNRNPT